MSLLASNVVEAATSTGTGTFNLGGPSGRFVSFVTGIGDGNPALYHAVNEANDEWEFGLGTVTDATPDTLSRDTILASSNSGSKVDFTAAPTVFIGSPAEVLASALRTNKGSSRPAWLQGGGLWADDSSSPVVIKYWDGSDDTPVGEVDESGNTFTAYVGSSKAGTAAAKNTGTSGATVPLLNGNNTYSGTSTFSGTVTMSAKPIEFAEGAAVASASSTDIWAGDDGNTVHITGTATITDFGTAPQAGAMRYCIADGAFTITHNATSLILPGGADWTVAAGATFIVYADTTSNMRIMAPTNADGTPLVTVSDVTVESAVDLTNGGADDLSTVTLLSGLSGADRIVIFLDRADSAGSDDYLVQLGDSGGFETTGYTSRENVVGDGSQETSTSGFLIHRNAASANVSGHMLLTRQNGGNEWDFSMTVVSENGGSYGIIAGNKTLSAELTQIRITVSGTDTFDNGTAAGQWQ